MVESETTEQLDTDIHDMIARLQAENHGLRKQLAHFQETPRHPLVKDQQTGLFRLARQDDIRRMERICAAYDRLVANGRQMFDDAATFSEQVAHGR